MLCNVMDAHNLSRVTVLSWDAYLRVISFSGPTRPYSFVQTGLSLENEIRKPKNPKPVLVDKWNTL